MTAPTPQSGPSNRFRLLPAAFVLAALPFAGHRPAAAQSDLRGIVCVCSELEIVPGPNRVPQVFRRDVEFGYLSGVEFEYKEEAERAVRAALDGYAQVWCAWSEPGDTHMAVVGYTAVARLGETLDPADPRFPNFAVGYGTGWEDSEAAATDLDERFSAYNDGSKYRILLQQGWDVAEDDVERPEVPWPEPAGLFRDCDVCPGMVVVPAGTFLMGSPDSDVERVANDQPQHLVTIDAPFAAGVYEVTFAEWDACVLAGACAGDEVDDEGWGRERRPVINATWEESQAYVQWLSQETGERYRLLSEAEWEYVARAGTEAARYWGDESVQCDHANAQDAAYLRGYPSRTAASCSDGYAETAPVGLYSPNAFGLHDVLGNVAEWTQDCLNPHYSGAPRDGSAWEQGNCTLRVLRGGSWATAPGALSTALRSLHPWDFGGSSIGFRVARTVN